MSPQDQPSRRSLLGSLAAFAAWLTGPAATPAASPPNTPSPPAPPTSSAPPATPEVIRVADSPWSAPAAFAGHGPADGPTTATLTYSASGLPNGLSINPSTGLITGHLGYPPTDVGQSATLTWAVSDTSAIAPSASPTPAPRPAPVHAACRLLSPSGEELGREEYEIAFEGGKRVIRVTTKDVSGAVMKTEVLPI